MSSERRLLASRANGAKSKGPITPEGKIASSRNSLRHGILSKTIVLEGESSEAFLALLTAYQDEHQPETPTEEALIENMAIARWRQERLWNMETAALDHGIRHPCFPGEDDFPTQTFLAFRSLIDDTRALELINRYEARFDRQFRTALAAFRSLRAERNPPNPPAKPDGPVTHKLFWIDDSIARLAADPSAPSEPENLLGSFGNSAFPPQSPSIASNPQPEDLSNRPAKPSVDPDPGKIANDSMEIGRDGQSGQSKPMNIHAIPRFHDGDQ